MTLLAALRHDASPRPLDGPINGEAFIAYVEQILVPTPEMAFSFHVADHGFDGGAAFEFALDGPEHAALLARE